MGRNGLMGEGERDMLPPSVSYCFSATALTMLPMAGLGAGAEGYQAAITMKATQCCLTFCYIL
jgi:hypothetical protein